MKKLLYVVVLLGFISFAGQVGGVKPAVAASGDPVNMNMYVGNMNASLPSGSPLANVWAHICASGTGDPITSITFDSVDTNIDMVSFVVAEPSVNNDATDLGSITGLTWTGVLDIDQCLVINPQGSVSGAIGETATWDFTIVSATHAGDVAVVDDVLTNQSDGMTLSIAEASDLAIETRLLTSGDITVGSNVSYEVLIQNIAGGQYAYNQIGLYYVLPVGSTFTSTIDLDLDDELSLLGCSSMGPVQDLGPAFANYEGEVISCSFENSLGHIPGNSEYPFQFNLEASAGFASGETQVIGVALAGDMGEPDSATFISAFMGGNDAFALDINNIMRLTYDSGELQVTINRCTGLGEVVEVDDACFTVSFNKLIWGPSFTEDDLVLDGGGNVYSFEQDDDYTWTVRINGMTLGGTLRLLLGAESVQDYSAVTNGVSVLGVNEIRYGAETTNSTGGNSSGGSSSGGSSSGDGSASADTTSASGVLAATGSDTTVYFIVAMVLILIGGALMFGSRARS
jgi:hypothetical protein